MKRIIIPAILGLFLFGCSANADKNTNEPAADPEIIEQEEVLQQIESAAQDITDEAEELAGEVDSLLNNL